MMVFATVETHASDWPGGAPCADAVRRILAGSDEDASEGADEVSAEGPVAGAARPRVLVVEDEFIISMELEHMLSDAGYEVVGVATEAGEALRLAEQHRPDFVTMDISLAGPRDGVSAATEIFDRFGIRSIFVSAFTDAETKERARAAHPYGWMAKPLFRSRFEQNLRSLLSEAGGA